TLVHEAATAARLSGCVVSTCPELAQLQSDNELSDADSRSDPPPGQRVRVRCGTCAGNFHRSQKFPWQPPPVRYVLAYRNRKACKPRGRTVPCQEYRRT